MVLSLSAVTVFAQAPSPAQQRQAPSDYIVGPQDVLSITVWDQTDLSGKYTVEADGSFTFPLIGRVVVGGLTLRQIDAALKKRLADGYFRDPQLSVAVETYRSRTVVIIGEVRTPGPYVLTTDTALLEALSRAGGTTPTAGPEVLIFRAPEGKAGEPPPKPGDADAVPAVRVNLKDLQSSQAQNIALKDGDIISVPKAETVFVFGFVKNPGSYALQQKETTVLQALALAGGVTDRGSTSRIKIHRVVDGQKQEIKVKLTDLVQPGDTIVVPERFF